ncbi:hypothetical protein RF11_11837 [Thelohanellus kitauei]|uniref:Uncharacterized protein n=1 Tax=Thelohanellus kitauei TaxID=669202 RepID=A0A0C2N1J3_THEKT|nr:hypothetical protein RF11_11837 [Thelohanellus kitauei]
MQTPVIDISLQLELDDDYKNTTALHLAAENELHKAISNLVAFGVNIEISNSQHMAAMEFEIDTNRKNTVMAILNNHKWKMHLVIEFMEKLCLKWQRWCSIRAHLIVIYQKNYKYGITYNYGFWKNPTPNMMEARHSRNNRNFPSSIMVEKEECDTWSFAGSTLGDKSVEQLLLADICLALAFASYKCTRSNEPATVEPLNHGLDDNIEIARLAFTS